MERPAHFFVLTALCPFLLANHRSSLRVLRFKASVEEENVPEQEFIGFSKMMFDVPLSRCDRTLALDRSLAMLQLFVVSF